MESPRKLMGVPSRNCTGSAIQLYPATTELIVAEGIETALSLYVALGKPAWACISAHGLETIQIPKPVEYVIIGADNDTNGTGQKAAKCLASRLRLQGKSVRIIVPDIPGFDWNDVLRQESAHVSR